MFCDFGETLLVGDLCRLGVKFNALGEFFLSGSGKIRCSIADFSGIHAETDVKRPSFEVFEENLAMAQFVGCCLAENLADWEILFLVGLSCIISVTGLCS